MHGLCRNCGIRLQRKSYIYCSNSCQAEYRYQAFIRNWLSGSTDATTARGVSQHVRRYLIEAYTEQCWQCGWKEKNLVTGKVPLEVDHIDGNYRRSTPDNLQMLCPNCHSLTSTFRNLNRGNGRELRRYASLAQR